MNEQASSRQRDISCAADTHVEQQHGMGMIDEDVGVEGLQREPQSCRPPRPNQDAPSGFDGLCFHVQLHLPQRRCGNCKHSVMPT